MSSPTKLYKSSLLLLIKVEADSHTEAKREVAKLRTEVLKALPVGVSASTMERRVSRI